LEELYSNAYVYVLPSDVEGMPLTLLEAMSYGNCCLVSDIPVHAEGVREYAATFTHGDTADLQAKLRKLCDTPETVSQFKRRAWDYICGKYSWDDVTEMTLTLYQKDKQRSEQAVLGADIGGIPELIKPGKTGELFESGNKEQLKKSLLDLWASLPKESLNFDQCKFADISTMLPQWHYRRREKMPKKLNGTVIVTCRCNARCNMCNRYKAPSKPEEEISLDTIRKLPPMYFTNITGGEPFIRENLKDIVRELQEKSHRIVISTNGFFTDRILDLCREFPNVGIRISIEGMEETTTPSGAWRTASTAVIRH